MVKERVVKLVMLMAAFSFAFVFMLGSGAEWWWIAAVGVVGIGLIVLTGRRGRHTSWEVARGQVGPGLAVVFWKPGCMFCEQLLRALGKDERITWVNVWVDKEANAEVRRLNNGDELTPTVLLGEHVLRNPSAQELRGLLSG